MNDQNSDSDSKLPCFCCEPPRLRQPDCGTPIVHQLSQPQNGIYGPEGPTVCGSTPRYYGGIRRCPEPVDYQVLLKCMETALVSKFDEMIKVLQSIDQRLLSLQYVPEGTGYEIAKQDFEEQVKNEI